MSLLPYEEKMKRLRLKYLKEKKLCIICKVNSMQFGDLCGTCYLDRRRGQVSSIDAIALRKANKVLVNHIKQNGITNLNEILKDQNLLDLTNLTGSTGTYFSNPKSHKKLRFEINCDDIESEKLPQSVRTNSAQQAVEKVKDLEKRFPSRVWYILDNVRRETIYETKR